MSIMKCGHPDKWVLKLKWNGRTYTYCLACLVETLKMDNLEVYNNPYIKVVKPKTEVKDGKKTEVKKLYENGKTPDEDSLKKAKEMDKTKKVKKTK